MKKILIFGLRDAECLCDVEYFLDREKFQIIGYSDLYSSLNYGTCGDSEPLAKRLPFFSLEKLKTLSFDYVVIPSFDETVTKTLTDKLIDLIGGGGTR